MPYTLSVPRAFPIDRPISVNITRLKINGFSVLVSPELRSKVDAQIQSGTGPYVDEASITFDLDSESTARILGADPTGINRISTALEKAVFDELAFLGKIPTGTVT